MNMKKLLCMALAVLLALGAMAALAEEDLQAQLDAANARIAELEAEVELYKPYYESQIVAEFGDGGIIWREDAMSEYQSAADAYAQYGLNIDDYAADIKQDILEMLVQQAVLDAKATELGLDQLDEEAMANLRAEAESTFETYVDSYRDYFAAENATDEEAREQTIAALAGYGLTPEALTEQMLDDYVSEQLHTYVTQDVAVTDEDIQAEYEAMVASDEAAYSDSDYSYNSARNNGETIAWNPEGYRAVKHVLIKFDDEQAEQYSDLRATLASLEDEKAALEAPAEEPAEDAEAEAPAEEPAEDADTEAEDAAEDAEPEAAPRTAEEIDADIAAVTAEIEALHEALLPQAQQVIDEFNAGTDFNTLIEQYNADPGMVNEPTATNGYAISASSDAYDPAFVEGAMSIAEIGQISAPIYGMNGIHIIYYLADITPGPVPFEEVAEQAESDALEEKINDTYNNQVAAWVEEANPVYHIDRF